MRDPFAHHGHDHPSVNAALAAQEKIDRIEAAREHGQEPDLRQTVRDLTDLVSDVCAFHVGAGVVDRASQEDMACLRDMHDRAEELLRRLA